ncbi:MAG: NUDIX hydrolase [Actinomycetota bacterium]|nr:NUDIX hydrolase [Actinomycetota bacterium]
MEESPYLTVQSDLKFKGKIFQLKVEQVQGPGGERFEREVVEHSQAVAIVALDTEGRLLLVKQYRHAAKKELWEIPAGLMEEGEEPLEAAKRELFEETGFEARKFDHLLSFYFTPGNSTEQLHLFLADDLSQRTDFIDHDEIIDFSRFSPAEAASMMEQGEIIDSKTIIGLLLLERHLKG